MQTESRGPGRLGGFRRTQVYSDLGGPLPLLEQNGRRRGGARGSHAADKRTSVCSAVAPSSARPGTARAPGRPDRQAQRRGSVAAERAARCAGDRRAWPGEAAARGSVLRAAADSPSRGGGGPLGEGAPRPARGSALHALGAGLPSTSRGSAGAPGPRAVSALARVKEPAWQRSKKAQDATRTDPPDAHGPRGPKPLTAFRGLRCRASWALPPRRAERAPREGGARPEPAPHVRCRVSPAGVPASPGHAGGTPRGD